MTSYVLEMFNRCLSCFFFSSIELVEPSCAAKLEAASKFPVAILIAIPAGLFILACIVIVRSLEKSRQEKKLLATEKEKEKEVPALKSSATDVNENKPVAMVTAQNFRPVIHERIRAVSIDEQRFNSLSTSSASEIEVKSAMSILIILTKFLVNF